MSFGLKLNLSEAGHFEHAHFMSELRGVCPGPFGQGFGRAGLTAIKNEQGERAFCWSRRRIRLGRRFGRSNAKKPCQISVQPGPLFGGEWRGGGNVWNRF